MINKWSYPDKTPQQAKGYEETRHVGNDAMFDAVIYEFSDDVKFTKRQDLTIRTEVEILDGDIAAEVSPSSNLPVDVVDDAGRLRDAQ